MTDTLGLNRFAAGVERRPGARATAASSRSGPSTVAARRTYRLAMYSPGAETRLRTGRGTRALVPGGDDVIAEAKARLARTLAGESPSALSARSLREAKARLALAKMGPAK